MMDFSVVIPTHNRAELVARTVAAFLAQGDADFELIVVDDGSTDNTTRRLQQVNDGRLHLVQQENRGLAAARNAGFALARRQYVLFNDDDIIPEPGFLGAHLELHRRFAHIAVVSRTQIPDSLGQDPFTRFWRARAENGVRGKSDAAALDRGGYWFASLSVERAHLPADPFASFPAYGWEEHELGLRLWKQGIRPRLATRARAAHEDRVNLEGMLTKFRSMGRMAWQFYRMHPSLEVALWTGANPISLIFKRWTYPWPRAEKILQERNWEQGEGAESAYRFLLEAAYTQGLLEGRGAS
ncbi:glycosyltransferase family 2 protein [uncultured Meiothermus sp.]|jgi:glycosyltransferase involved in cell wall biosynthesis|uniref:glycosyltransferase family 2 protein n=1 Tax=uncultured Meiothermus sp. TaxID=157471 RepID=UPI0026184404|nr:glycosyltransferase family 2 protein [uncultured Meiothermus sp.]